MKKYLVFIAFVLVLACGRYDKQYSKVLSEGSTQDTIVTCQTLFGLPYACFQKNEIRTNVKIIEFVDKIIKVVVTKERIVEVPKEVIVERFIYITETLEEETGAATAVEVISDTIAVIAEYVPAEALTNATLQEVVAAVEPISTRAYAPTVAPVSAPATSVKIASVKAPPTYTPPIVVTPPPVEKPVIVANVFVEETTVIDDNEHQHTEVCETTTERVDGVAGNNGLADRRFAYVKAHNQVDGEVRSVQYGFWDEDGDHAIDPDEHEIWTVTYYNCESMR